MLPVASKSGVAPVLRDSRRSPKSLVAPKAALGLSVVQSLRTDADSLEKLKLKWPKSREDLPKIEIL